MASDGPLLSTSRDAFLDGRLVLDQPCTGYRIAIDPFFLAAAVPAQAGDQVLDVGCGVGAAALALACRVPGCHLTGIELQPTLADLAAGNAARHAIPLTLWRGDLADPAPDWPRNSFDHVLTNPPYLEPADGTPPPDGGRALAHVNSRLSLAGWLAQCLRFLRPGGSVTVVHRADRLDAILAAMIGKAGAIEVFPLWPKPGQPARRVLVRARKGRKTPLTLHPGLMVHRADGGFSPAAEAILRQGRSVTEALQGEG